jgi:N-dimethylarginine dimethylaminohydrolase
MVTIEGNTLIIEAFHNHFQSELRSIKRYEILYISEVGEETFNEILKKCQYIEIHSVETDYFFTRRMRTCIRYDEIIIISW